MGIGMMSCVDLFAAGGKSSVAASGKAVASSTVNRKSSGNADPAASLNIAVVDLAEVYSGFYPAKAAQENFRLLAQQAESELEKMMNEGKPLFEERDALIKKLEAPALGEDAKKKLEEQLSAVVQKIQRKGQEIGLFQQEKEMKLNEQRQTVLAEHFKEINLDMERMAKERNLVCILNKTAVLYAEPALDLTAEAVREVNKPYQKEIREAEKKAAEAAKKANETKEEGKK